MSYIVDCQNVLHCGFQKENLTLWTEGDLFFPFWSLFYFLDILYCRETSQQNHSYITFHIEHLHCVAKQGCL
jgi:hypothetical protein